MDDATTRRGTEGDAHSHRARAGRSRAGTMSGSPQESGMSADRWLAKAFGDVSVDGDARASRESRGGRARDEVRRSDGLNGHFRRGEPFV